MSLSKDDRKEIDNAYSAGDYVVKKGMPRFFFWVIAIVVFCTALGFGVKVFTTNADREIFKQSLAYNESAAQFLAKSMKEYNDTDALDEKKAIMEYAVDRYPNLDLDSIDNEKLRTFYENALTGTIY